MPALPPYIPPKEADFTEFLDNFSSLINADAPAFGIMPAQASDIASLNDAWIAAYSPVTSPASRTAQAVQDKNIAKVTVTSQIRTYAQAIANNPGVTAGNKISLGLNPKTSAPQPITPPDSVPLLTAQGGSSLQLFVRYADNVSVSTKSKPYGCGSCQMFYAVSDTPITLYSQLTQSVVLTKSPTKVTFPETAGGMKAYMAAYWLLRNGKRGDWGPIISATVPGA